MDHRSGDFAAKRNLLQERFGEGIGYIGESGHATGRRQQVANQLHALAREFGGHAGDPGDISARPRKARDESRADRISGLSHDDGDVARRLSGRHSGRREPGDDYIDVEADQLGGQFGQPARVTLRRSKLEANVLPFDIAKIAQALSKFPPKLSRVGVTDDQCADDRQLRRLLRARRERPRSRASEQGDEIASFQLIESHPMPISRG